MPGPQIKQDQKYTYKDYLNWPEDERWEIINGEVYDMSPSPSMFHQRISGDLFNQFYNYLKDKTCEVFNAPCDVVFENNEYTDTVVQPDIFVVCDKSKLTSKGCVGAPDLVIEILSPFTAKKDLKEKFLLYERVGVKEYWIVHQSDKFVSVYKLDENNKYKMHEIYSESDTIKVEIFEDLTIELESVFKEA